MTGIYNSTFLNSGYLGFSHYSMSSENFTHSFLTQDWWWQPSWIWHNGGLHSLPVLDSDTLMICSSDSLRTLSLHPVDDSAIIAQNNSNSFILTQLNDGRHLEFCHVGFRHCHLGFRHLSFSSKTLSDSLKNTLTPLWCWLKLIQSD